MGYRKAAEILPHHLLAAIQKYIDGEYIYIPRKDDNRKAWGETTGTKQSRRVRNTEIFRKHRNGYSVRDLAEMYFLSAKTIYKIVNAERNG